MNLVSSSVVAGVLGVLLLNPTHLVVSGASFSTAAGGVSSSSTLRSIEHTSLHHPSSSPLRQQPLFLHPDQATELVAVAAEEMLLMQQQKEDDVGVRDVYANPHDESEAHHHSSSRAYWKGENKHGHWGGASGAMKFKVRSILPNLFVSSGKAK